MAESARRFAAVAISAIVMTIGCSGGGDDADEASVSADSSIEAGLPAVDDETTTSGITTTTLSPEALAAAELAADTELIVQVWRDASDAWGLGDEAGIQRGFQFLFDNSYPGFMNATDAAACRTQLEGGVPFTSYRSETIVDAATVARDDGWTMSGGPLDGQVPNGRIYIHQIDDTQVIDGVPSQGREEIHATVIDGRAYFFVLC